MKRLILVAVLLSLSGCSKEPAVQQPEKAAQTPPNDAQWQQIDIDKLQKTVIDAQTELSKLEQLRFEFVKAWSAENDGKPATPQMQAKYDEMMKTFESKKKAALDSQMAAELKMMK